MPQEHSAYDQDPEPEPMVRVPVGQDEFGLTEFAEVPVKNAAMWDARRWRRDPNRRYSRA